MRIRWILFIIVSACLIGGLVAGVYARSIEAALTTQPVASQGTGGTQGKPPTVTQSPTTGQSRPSATPTTPPKATPTPATTPLPTGVSVLARDTFQRAAQVFWGTASDGNMWVGDANSIEIFSITHDAGLIAAGQGAFNAILGPSSTDAEIVVSATVNQFAANGAVNLGVALRWKDGNNWYKALINGSQLQILSRVQGVTKVLAAMPFTAAGGTSYTLRFRAMGANLLAKAWLTGQPEPANWLLQTTDTALTQGMGGIRVVLQNTTTIQVTSFLETTVGIIG
ncbi:MAG TPA: hypothetical protein VGT44_22950 [Ktedonobacteraceae bacterium]|nr:hypothetical protein [Ktedonobacteraceae bacterium]